MKLRIVIIALLCARALSGCASQSQAVVPPVAVVSTCPTLPAPPAWAMVPPPTQTSTQRLRSAFSQSLAMTKRR